MKKNCSPNIFAIWRSHCTHNWYSIMDFPSVCWAEMKIVVVPDMTALTKRSHCPRFMCLWTCYCFLGKLYSCRPKFGGGTWAKISQQTFWSHFSLPNIDLSPVLLKAHGTTSVDPRWQQRSRQSLQLRLVAVVSGGGRGEPADTGHQ